MPACPHLTAPRPNACYLDYTLPSEFWSGSGYKVVARDQACLWILQAFSRQLGRRVGNQSQAAVSHFGTRGVCGDCASARLPPGAQPRHPPSPRPRRRARSIWATGSTTMSRPRMRTRSRAPRGSRMGLAPTPPPPRCRRLDGRRRRCCGSMRAIAFSPQTPAMSSDVLKSAASEPPRSAGARSPSTVWMHARLEACTRSARSSAVSAATRRTTRTGRVWPRR